MTCRERVPATLTSFSRAIIRKIIDMFVKVTEIVFQKAGKYIEIQ